MAKRSDNFMKRLLIDIGGILLVILAILVGWLPGPLGIPLLLAGLGLLSINHEWAERWLERAKSGGVKIMDKIFSDNLAVKWLLDIGSLVMFGGALYILTFYDKRLLISLAIALIVISLVLFFGNRKRATRIWVFVTGKR